MDSNHFCEPEIHSSTSVSDSDEDLRVFENHAGEPQSEDEQAADNSHVYRLNLLSWSNRLELESIDLKEKTLEFINEFKHLLNNSKILSEINEKNSYSNPSPSLRPEDLKTLEKNVIQQIKTQFSNEFFNLQQTIKKFNALNTPCKPKTSKDLETQDFFKNGSLTKLNEQIIRLSSKIDNMAKQQNDKNSEMTKKSDSYLNYLKKKIEDIDSRLSILQKKENSDKFIKNNLENADVFFEKSQSLLNDTIQVLNQVKSEINVKRETSPLSSCLLSELAKTEIAIKPKTKDKSQTAKFLKQEGIASQKVQKNKTKASKSRRDSKLVKVNTTKYLQQQNIAHVPITRSHTTILRKTPTKNAFTKLQQEIDIKQKLILTPPNSQMRNSSFNTPNLQDDNEESMSYLADDITYEDKAYENQLMIMGIGKDDDQEDKERERMLV